MPENKPESKPGTHSNATSQGGGINPSAPGSDHLDLSRLTSGSRHSMTTNQPRAAKTFRCADAGNADCSWETSGATDDEIVHRAEEHWRKHHGMGDWTEAMRSKARAAIKHRQAA